MTTKAAFITAYGGAKVIIGIPMVFTRVAGDVLSIVGHGMETGAGPCKVCTNFSDAPAGLVASVKASTFLTATNPVATDVVIINGRTYTYIATPAAADDVDVGAGTPAGTSKSIGNLCGAIVQDIDADPATYHEDTTRNADVVAAVIEADILRFSAKTFDATAGNAITVSSPDGTLIVDNPTLQGGIDGQDYFFIKIDDDTFSLATTRALALAGTAVTITDAGTGVHTLVALVESLAEALEDVVVNYLTKPGNRVNKPAFNIARFWQAAIDGNVNSDDAN